MTKFRNEAPDSFGGQKVAVLEDFELSTKTFADGHSEEMTLPKSNVLKYILEDGSWIAVRPSGTEPKIKFYIGTQADSQEASLAKRDNFEADINAFVNA